jgi:hypothetical protein
MAAGCGSSEYNAQIEATAADLRRNQPEEPVAAEEHHKSPILSPKKVKALAALGWATRSVWHRCDPRVTRPVPIQLKNPPN